MNAKQILLRVFSGILALVCVLCLVLSGLGLKQTLDCKAYWEKQGEEAEEGFDKLEDGINQLRDNEDAYLSGVEAYEEGLEEYEKGEEELAAGADKLNNGQAQYDSGAARLADAHKQYDENMEKLNAAKAELEAGKAQLEAGKAELAAGEAELAAHQQEYEEGKAKLETVTPIYETAMAGVAKINDLKAERDRYASMGPLFEKKVTELDLEIAMAEAALNTQLQGYSVNGIIQEYEDGQAKIAEYEAGQRRVEEGRKQIEEGEKKIAESEKQIAEAEQKLAEAKATLDEKDQELANAKGQLDAGYADYEAGEEKLAAGAEQLADGLKQLGQYEGGQDQVVDGLETVLGTDTYYNRAHQALLPAIRERLDPNFSYWKLDENGQPLVVNGHKNLSLSESLKVVRAGRDFLADTTKIVTAEITGRLLVMIVSALAIITCLIASILGLCGRRIGALIPAILGLVCSVAAITMALISGTENPMSVIAGTGTVGVVLGGVIALAVAALLVTVFAAIPGSGRLAHAAAPARAYEPAPRAARPEQPAPAPISEPAAQAKKELAEDDSEF